MKSIFPAVLFGFVLIIFFDDAAAMNKDESLPSHINTLQPDSIKQDTIKQRVQPVQYTLTRGQMLYENHCLSCHESQLHIRAKTKVKKLSQLRYFVIIRSSELKLRWGDDEIDAVTKHLNQRFYQLP